MFTIKDNIKQIQTVFSTPFKPELQVPFFSPSLTPEPGDGFERKKAYFYFANAKTPVLRQLRAFLFIQAIRQEKRVLVQDPGYLHYEDFQDILTHFSPTLSLLTVLRNEKEVFAGLNKLESANVQWVRQSAEQLAQQEAPQEPLKNPDIIVLALTQKEVCQNPCLAQNLAEKKNCIVWVFVEQSDEEAAGKVPLRTLLRQTDSLQKVGAELSFLDSIHISEAMNGGGYREVDLIAVNSWALVNVYIETYKDYELHDGILEWYVREAD